MTDRTAAIKELLVLCKDDPSSATLVTELETYLKTQDEVTRIDKFVSAYQDFQNPVHELSELIETPETFVGGFKAALDYLVYFFDLLDETHQLYRQDRSPVRPEATAFAKPYLRGLVNDAMAKVDRWEPSKTQFDAMFKVYGSIPTFDFDRVVTMSALMRLSTLRAERDQLEADIVAQDLRCTNYDMVPLLAEKSVLELQLRQLEDQKLVFETTKVLPLDFKLNDMFESYDEQFAFEIGKIEGSIQRAMEPYERERRSLTVLQNRVATLTDEIDLLVEQTTAKAA